MRRFFSSIIMVAMSIVMFGCGGANTKSEVQYMDVKAEDMLNDYIRDTSMAQNKYKGRNVLLTGQLQHKGQFNNSSNFYAVLSQKYMLGRRYNIVVSYPVDKNDEINKLKYGDYVVAKGECVGIVPQKDPTEISVQVEFGKVGNGSNIPVASNTSTTTTAPSPSNDRREGIITGTDVRVREYGGLSARILGYFEKGERVRIIEVNEKWTKVERANGQIGWVSNDFCALQ